ncbi:pilus assembly protein TadG-related protein [Streptomyces sp. NPDC050617]|uniref:pilus assembly protein TadG-related protein n=1 Tax=Streptomyces sp. NPDC050617 TaxID=3154628 RepID=UPI00342451E9
MTGTRPARWARGDAGQAFPIYITAVVGILFIALAFFAVGQAGAKKNGAQTAADASALAAAQDYRDQLLDGFLKEIGDEKARADWLSGRGADRFLACDAAGAFAAKNDAEVDACDPFPDFTSTAFTSTAFTVKVTSLGSVGRSVVPGTENQKAYGRAKAVVEPRCALASDIPGHDAGGRDGDSGADDKGKGKGKGPLIELICEGRPVSIDPEKPDPLPRAQDLFTVRLAD